MLSREKTSRWSGTVHVIFLIILCIIKMFMHFMHFWLKIAHSALTANYKSDRAFTWHTCAYWTWQMDLSGPLIHHFVSFLKGYVIPVQMNCNSEQEQTPRFYLHRDGLSDNTGNAALTTLGNAVRYSYFCINVDFATHWTIFLENVFPLKRPIPFL